MRSKSQFLYTSPASNPTPEIPCLQRGCARQALTSGQRHSPASGHRPSPATVSGRPQYSPALPARRLGQPHRRDRRCPEPQRQTAFAACLASAQRGRDLAEAGFVHEGPLASAQRGRDAVGMAMVWAVELASAQRERDPCECPGRPAAGAASRRLTAPSPMTCVTGRGDP